MSNEGKLQGTGGKEDREQTIVITVEPAHDRIDLNGMGFLFRREAAHVGHVVFITPSFETPLVLLVGPLWTGLPLLVRPCPGISSADACEYSVIDVGIEGLLADSQAFLSSVVADDLVRGQPSGDSITDNMVQPFMLLWCEVHTLS